MKPAAFINGNQREWQQLCTEGLDKKQYFRYCLGNTNNVYFQEKYYDQPISNGDVSGREEVEREVKNDEVAEIRPNGERHRENINEDFISAEKNIFKKNNTDKTSYTKKYESFLRKNLENGVHTINKELYYLKQNSPYGLKQEVKFDFVEEPIDLTYTQKLPTRTSLEVN